MTKPSNGKLELAWEGVQYIYPTHGNVSGYRDTSSFCSFAEQTFLIKTQYGNKTSGYYDTQEFPIISEAGLRDFLDPTWRSLFRKKTQQVATDTAAFILKYRGRHMLTKTELSIAIKQGTQIHEEAYLLFCACQPQFFSRADAYLKTLVPDTISEDEKTHIILTLSQSEEKTLITREECGWGGVVKGLKEKYGDNPPPLSEYDYPEFDTHLERYDLLGAADDLPPWDKAFLYKRLLADYHDESVIHFSEQWEQKRQAWIIAKQDVIAQYHPSAELVELCKAVAEFGDMRMQLRIEGWMNTAYILMKELFPLLTQYVPYSLEQLQSTTPAELDKILDGDYSLPPEQLSKRYELVLYGLLNGEEVLWSGDEAQRMVDFYLPKVDTQISELHGQVAWRGVVCAPCYVIRWDAQDIAATIDAMPHGAILVAGQTRPQLMSAIKKAAAIVTDEGGILSHAAIVSREMKKPCIIGTKIATQVLKDGDVVEVDAQRGVVTILKRNQM